MKKQTWRHIGLCAIFAALLLISVASAFALPVSLTPNNPDTTDSLTCDVSGTNDVFTYRWYKNGNYGNQIHTNTASQSNLPSFETSPNDNIHCLAYLPATEYDPEIYVGQANTNIAGNNQEDDPECDDGIDNDGDGEIDWPEDDGCDDPDDDDETDPDPQNTAPNLNLPNRLEDEFNSVTFFGQYINLWTYASDAETSDNNLEFQILSETNPAVVDCFVTGDDHYLACTFGANEPGSSTIQVRVTDEGGLSDVDSFTITVQDVNAAPEIAGIPDQYLEEASGFNANIVDLFPYAFDADHTDVQLSFDIVFESNAGLVDCIINADRYVSCTTNAGVGQSTVTVEVSDGQYDDTDTFTVYVVENAPPIIDGIPDQYIDEDSGLNPALVDLWTYTIDGDTPFNQLQYDVIAQTNPILVDCEVSNGHHIDCTTQLPNLVGSSFITVQVDDGVSTDIDVFKVNVEPVNDCPTIDPINDVIVTEGEIVNVNPSGNDVDGDTLFASCSNPLGANCFWQTQDGDEGVYPITATIDDLQCQDSTMFNVIVEAAPTECNDGINNDADPWTDWPDDPGCDSPDDESEDPNPACSDGIDNDWPSDGLIDWPADPGCEDIYDDDEYDFVPECSDGIDNDLDGWVDWPQDPGCTSADDPAENPNPACSDGVDNDIPPDGLVDYPNDPGCANIWDDDEYDFVPECSDGINNDADPWTDWPEDPGCSGPDDDDESDNPECSDGFDNDWPADGFVDWPNDPGCDDIYDDDEFDAPVVYECSDGIDNDLDGFVDWPADPGCLNPLDDSEWNQPVDPQCSDGVDNDGDTFIDWPTDPGCDSPDDNNEVDNTPECSDGVDNDLDGFIDWPLDPGCTDANDDDESNNPECSDGIDNDFDGFTDWPNDPGCSDAFDDDESNNPQCSDGLDNDGDLLIDWPQDPGCDSHFDDNEVDNPECSDGIDNDLDGFIDYPDDLGCDSPDDNSEMETPNVAPSCDIDPNSPIDVTEGDSVWITGEGEDSDGVIAQIEWFYDGLFAPFIDTPNTDSVDHTLEYEFDTPGSFDWTFTVTDDDGASCVANVTINVEAYVPECSDGIDNDNDGFIDYPDDFGCDSANDDDEQDPPQCSDGIDNDGDGFVDMDDPACDGPNDDDESDDPQCNDGIDNDGDGNIDFPDDDGCTSPHDDLEYRDAPKKSAPKINNAGEKLVISHFQLVNGDDLSAARCDLDLEDVVLGPNVIVDTDGCLQEVDKFNELGILLALFNDDSKKAYDVVVTFDIMDLHVRKVSNRFNINAHGVVEKKLKFEVPAGTLAGVYPVRIEVVSERDNSKRRVLYRDIVITQPQVTKHVHEVNLITTSAVQEPTAPVVPAKRSIIQMIIDAILAIMADIAALLFRV